VILRIAFKTQKITTAGVSCLVVQEDIPEPAYSIDFNLQFGGKEAHLR